MRATSTPATRVRTGAVAVGLAVAASTALAAPASAVTSSHSFTCGFPLVGSVPARVDVDTAFPNALAVGEESGPTRFAVAVTPRAFEAFLTSVGATTVEGRTSPEFDVTGAGRSGAIAILPTLEPIQSPRFPFAFQATGSLASLAFPEAGTATYGLQRVRLNLTAFKADGVPVQLPSVGPDSDGNPDTFDVACVPVSGTAASVGRTQVGGGAPSTPEPTPTPDPTPRPGPTPSPTPSPTPAPDDSRPYSCVFPVVGGVPARVIVSLNTRPELRTGEESGPTRYTVSVRADGVRERLGISSVFGRVVPAFGVSGAGRSGLVSRLPGEDPTPGGTGEPLFFGSGALESLSFPEAGTATYSLQDLRLNLRAYDRNSQPVTLPTSGVDSDGDPTSFDVSCFPAPGSSIAVGTTKVVPGTTPTPEPTPVVTPTPFPTPTPEPDPTPLPLPVRQVFDASGSATIKTLSKGTLPLKGSLDMRSSSTPLVYFTADLALQPTTARLVALGFIPVTASVQFVRSGQTTGVLRRGVLTSTSKVRIKLPKVSLFGTIPLAGGSTCQTKQLSDLALASPSFTVSGGGTLTSAFAISDLSGCGALNGLVSPLTAGGGNTVSLKLTPRAS